MNYITESQKNEIDKKYFPNGYFWLTPNFDPMSKERRLSGNFESLDEYDADVKSLLHSNALCFFHHIKKLNEADFIKEINVQYRKYTIENKENGKLWLSLTYDLVIKGFDVAGRIDESLINAFINWYDAKNPPQQVDTKYKTEVLLKNEHPQIFKNDLGFTLFTKMFELYKDESTRLANFSFLYHAMDKEFLVCSQTDYILLLESEEYNIKIEKVDSRQAGINKKTKLYNSIKEQLQKKHNISTI